MTNEKHGWAITATIIIQVILFICKIALIVLLIRPIVAHEITTLLTGIPLLIVAGMFIHSTITSLIHTISDISYLNSLTDEQLDVILHGEYSEQQDLKYLLTHTVQYIDDKSIKGNVRGIYIKWNKKQNKMDVACYLYNGKMYPMDKLVYINEEDNE